jgi:hypothetical protein
VYLVDGDNGRSDVDVVEYVAPVVVMKMLERWAAFSMVVTS